jgi:Uma2 family endonuclease
MVWAVWGGVKVIVGRRGSVLKCAMARAPELAITLDDYLQFEDASLTRHEFVGGRIHRTSDNTMRHNRISGNALRVLGDHFEGTPCQVFMINVKLHVRATDSVYYPDVFVYCGSTIADGAKLVDDALLVVEVASDSTVSTDRREKRMTYQKLPGLRTYWLFSQTERLVEIQTRNTEGIWTISEFTADDAVSLDGVIVASLGRIYAGTDIA